MRKGLEIEQIKLYFTTDLRQNSESLKDTLIEFVLNKETKKYKAEIVEYSYTKDLENSDDYPLYSVEFLADINGDGKSDLISRSVTEFNVSYDIFEYKNGEFVRVLSETMKVK